MGYVAAIKASNAVVFKHFILAYLLVFMKDWSSYIMFFFNYSILDGYPSITEAKSTLKPSELTKL